MDIQTIVDHHGNAPPIGSKRAQSSKAVNRILRLIFLFLSVLWFCRAIC